MKKIAFNAIAGGIIVVAALLGTLAVSGRASGQELQGRATVDQASMAALVNEVRLLRTSIEQKNVFDEKWTRAMELKKPLDAEIARLENQIFSLEERNRNTTQDITRFRTSQSNWESKLIEMKDGPEKELFKERIANEKAGLEVLETSILSNQEAIRRAAAKVESLQDSVRRLMDELKEQPERKPGRN